MSHFQQRWAIVCAALCMCLLWVGSAAVYAMGKAPEPRRYAIFVDDSRLRVELALTEAEWGKGLMYRESLKPDTGMLFVFNEPARASFWMKHTTIPLDIAYFDAEGNLLELYPMHPNDLTPVTSRSNQIAFALEVPRGWFKAQNIAQGAQLKLQTVAWAIEAHRGFGALPTRLVRWTDIPANEG